MFAELLSRTSERRKRADEAKDENVRVLFVRLRRCGACVRVGGLCDFAYLV